MNTKQLAGQVLSGDVSIEDALKRISEEQLGAFHDSERLDYLDDPMTADQIGVGYSDTLTLSTNGGTWGYVHAGKWHATFREAVDAAMGRRA